MMGNKGVRKPTAEAPSSSSNVYQEDEALAKRIAAGDQIAETRLYNKYREPFLVILRNQLPHVPETHEEIYNDTMTTTIMALRQGKIQKPRALCGYMHTICLRKVYDCRKKPTNIESIGDEDFTDDESATDEKVIKEEAIAWVVRAYKTLRVRERRVLFLFYVRELSMRQIAKKLGLTEVNARKIKERSIKKLREEAQTVFGKIVSRIDRISALKV